MPTRRSAVALFLRSVALILLVATVIVQFIDRPLEDPLDDGVTLGCGLVLALMALITASAVSPLNWAIPETGKTDPAVLIVGLALLVLLLISLIGNFVH